MNEFYSNGCVPLWPIPDDMPRHVVLSHLDAVRAMAKYYELCNRILIEEINGVAKQCTRRGFSYDELLADHKADISA